MATLYKFYTLPLQQDVIELLHARGYDQHDPAVNDDTVDDFYLIIDRPDKRFWISCAENLEDSKQIVDHKFHEQIISTTLKDIQSWPT